MDYEKVYDAIIDQAKSECRGLCKELGYEIHHVIPKAFGGTNDKSNLIKLKLREHFIVHRLLAKFATGADKMKMRQALVLMCGSGNYDVSSRTFEQVKLQRSVSLRSIKVESFGTPVTHFPLGYFVEHFRSNYPTPKIKQCRWSNKMKGFYYYAIQAQKLGYEGITMGGSYGAHSANCILSKFIELGFLKQPYKGVKGRIKIYDFTYKFIEISRDTKGHLWVHKIPSELATAPKGKRGVGVAKKSVTEWNKQNLRKMVKLMWSKNDPYIKKVNAWKGDLPNLKLK